MKPITKFAIERLTEISKEPIRNIPGYYSARLSIQDLSDLGESSHKIGTGSFRPTFRNWINDLKRVQNKGTYQPKRILCFAYLPWWLELCAALSIVLCSRNCHIDLVWLDEPADYLSPYTYDHKQHVRQIRYQRARYAGIARETGRVPIQFIQLSKIKPEKLSFAILQDARAQSLIDTVYSSKKEIVDTDCSEKALYERRLRRNIDCMLKMMTLFTRQRYDSVLIPSGSVLEFGAVYRLASSLGLSTTTFEFWLSGRINIAHNERVMEMNSSRYWIQDEPHVLSLERRQIVQNMINIRQDPTSSREDYAYQRAKLTSPDELRQELGLHPNKIIVLVCPNVPFDGMFVGRNSFFPSMSRWLVETIKHLNQRKGVEVIIRAHPAECIWKPQQTAETILRNEDLLKEKHIHFIAPEAAINTYALMRITDIGIVYSSTTGMEMPLFGIPVICANSSHYNNKGFTIDPATLQEYFFCIDQLLTSPNRLTERQTELAWCYYDVHFNHWPKSFPWSVGTFWQDICRWPTHRVLSEEGKTCFDDAFEALAGRHL